MHELALVEINREVAVVIAIVVVITVVGGFVVVAEPPTHKTAAAEELMAPVRKSPQNSGLSAGAVGQAKEERFWIHFPFIGEVPPDRCIASEDETVLQGDDAEGWIAGLVPGFQLGKGEPIVGGS
eukprot:CAMPEP_0196667228 /NCGR_PEP_ID=MMETSP1086-20130531/64966_1 /TAXON_ID=77921 /ORGANISM="Cyanoptyche  gloeocystis , Strain SAG4.97" /LENGTH=124 /DNA_ID=CAMNT_0042004537 /DNA_START=1006 /DNA_END=1376 /DNA_ORIENTATION=-